ncbi:hypothetical protein DFH07DRAFT_696783, partial [Mycena maculata]
SKSRRNRSPSPARSSSPIAGDKRARSSEDDDMRTMQAHKINDHQGRPRAKDYDKTTQELISIANTWFRCLLAAWDRFPDHVAEQAMLLLAWKKACEEVKVSMRVPPDFAKMITRHGPQMRGELKTKVRRLVEIIFGFDSCQNKKNIRKNRQRAEDLKEGLGYCYEVISNYVQKNPAKAEGRRGLYKAKTIQKATNLMWFSNRRDEGAMHPELFGPIFPKPAFALVLSAIECAIDEWATGIKTNVPFTSAEYHSVYQEQLKCFDLFEKHTEPRGILDNILTRMHSHGCFHSGAQPITPVASALALSRTALDAANKEYDEEEATESDSEL